MVTRAKWIAHSPKIAHILTPKQERAVAALLIAPDQSAAAAACGISRRTITRWLADPTFRERYREHSHRLLQDATGRLRATAGEAVDTLRTALKADADAVKVRAAVAILGVAVKVGIDDLAARVAALEEQQGARRRWA